MMERPTVLLHPGVQSLTAEPARLRAAFAQRHVPLPPALAVSLAAQMAARFPTAEPFWGRMYAMMSRALHLSGAIAPAALLKEAAPLALVRVCEPILRAAAAQVGKLPLVIPELADLSGTDGAERVEQEIARFVDRALGDPDVMGRAFWAAAAMDLLGEARAILRGRAARAAAVTEPPILRQVADPALTVLIFLKPPVFEAERKLADRRQKARHLSLRRRAGVRPKEGGVAGIRPSASMEDLSDALMSELILPRAMFANRLVHEGLLVHHRPPRREPRRDLLAATLVEAGAEDGMGLLIRATWADCAIRLRVALNQLNLANSNLILAGLGGAAGHLDGKLTREIEARLPPLQIDGKARSDMLMGSGLFPDFLRWPDRGETDLPGDPDWPVTRRLLGKAIGAVPHRARQGEAQLIDEYGAHFLLWAGPVADPAAQSWAEARAALLDAAGPNMRGRAFCARLVWKRGTGGAAELLGQCDSVGVGELNLLLPKPPVGRGEVPPGEPADLPEFMGRLVVWMMDATLEALNGKA